MRPVGEFRQLLHAAFAERGPLTIRAAAGHTCIGYDVARRTVSNMVRAGVVRTCGREKAERSTNWEFVFELVPEDERGDAGPAAGSDLSLEELVQITSGWRAVDAGRA